MSNIMSKNQSIRWLPLQSFIIVIGMSGMVSLAQAATSITQTMGAGDLGTSVTQNGNVYGITGGQQVGSNLFHSFAQFNVATGDVAQFQTSTLNPDAAIGNILSRVTGGNPSSIFGTIDSATYYPNANFFFMNPAGILFGPNATLNVGGMVAFTTADYLRLTDGGRFNANPTLTGESLTIAPIAAFGFLGSDPAAITIQGSTLQVAQGQSLSFVGGSQGFTAIDPDTGNQISTQEGITISSGQLVALGGQINLASVASSGEILLPNFQPVPNFNGQSFTTMGDIALVQGTTLDVSANAAGTVRIRGGQLTIADSLIAADTVDVNGASKAVDIQLTGDLTISNELGPAITARTFGSGNAGEVNIVSSNLSATSNSFDFFSFIDTHTLASGRAGDVSIVTGDLTINGSLDGLISFIDSGTEGSGNGGNVTISTRNATFNNTAINTGNLFANFFGIDATGSAGNLNISSTGSLGATFSVFVTEAVRFDNEPAAGGNINLSAHDMNFFLSQVSSQGNLRGGSITVSADEFYAEDSQFITQTNLTSGGGITLTGRLIELSTGSSLLSSTGGDGDAGPIVVTATNQLLLTRANDTDRPSGIFSNSRGFFGSNGNAGDITINTPLLEMTGGARINTSTSTSGRGGNVNINANSISMSGESGSFSPEPMFNLGVTQSSGIFTLSVGGNCAGPCGNAGNISINTSSLSMGTGSQINSGTSSSGNGGTILINATDTIAMSGTLSTGQSGGIQSRSTGADPDAGSGGDITLTAGQSVTISDGAAVSASSTGPADAGNISINAGQQLTMQDSSITTEAAQAAGGNIDIQAIQQVHLDNSTISTSVLGGSGGGGNITIDPVVISLQNNSSILAQAVFGNGGNILLNTNLLLVDPSSVISASSQFGQSGTIQSPTSNLAGTVGSLPSSLNKQQALQAQRCAVLAEQGSSSFVIAGREMLPTEPGGWLTSPYAALRAGERLGARGNGIQGGGAGQGAKSEGEERQTFGPEDGFTVSLRHLTPAGFLTQRFADGFWTGCRA